MKTCIGCNKNKRLSEFYAHPEMADGHLNKCKGCVRSDVRVRQESLSTDPVWREKEKQRGREKYHRLHYKNKQSKRKKKLVMKRHYELYPEKRIAKSLSGNIVVPKGLQKHHWSYNKQHAKDVIFLTALDHAKLHRYMVYDQERKMYRTTTGVLLDTKESHLEYWRSLKDEP